ncbi:tRNA (guanosine(37)-N1)-methyltransferase TrmD [Limibaculum sp. FT325]|uniref:tRNA (guanosine(37)-N1)-methyltransferase TrmD n=1 Tax=Thermohalobaculum sediminis TaxID=2939436 RepID=UPI0020BE80B6|nr:tRNA (guanosine(37)-N1)-methyltransferase TrmD [Limibaculum sediminis]MCL5777056.1 tRNA (guanosine(37)-N1)-methyltransferase TrmD [Limibaculum sediminis]
MTDTPKPRSQGMFQPRVTARPRPLMEDLHRPGAFTARVLTLFPGMFPGPLGESLIGKALTEGLWRLEPLDIREFARNKHRTVDDTPAGGGPGMVLKPDVVAAAIDASMADAAPDRARWPLIYVSPRGRVFDQAMARQIAAAEGVTLLCGRFEGVDQRVLDARGVEEVSIGDYVLTGGELAAMVILDAVLRLRPGVLGNEASTAEESFSRGLLEHPQYTRPQVWEGRAIPEVLLSGHHARIAEWRHSEAVRLTKERRPDLWRAWVQATQGDPAGEAELSDAETSAATGGHEKD